MYVYKNMSGNSVSGTTMICFHFYYSMKLYLPTKGNWKSYSCTRAETIVNIVSFEMALKCTTVSERAINYSV